MARNNYTEWVQRFSYRYPFLSSLFIHINFWVISFLLLIIIRHLILLSVNEVEELPIPLNLTREIVQGITLGMVYAVLLTIINYLLDKRLTGYAFGLQVIIRSILFFVMFLALWAIGSAYFEFVVMKEVELPRASFIFQFYVMLIYTAVSAVLFGYFTQVNKSYGPGVLLPILLGYYRKPVREYRIFLFADLNSSTTYAEKLGMHAYSLLIQECFNIANKIIPQHYGQIYQYVGDEIVLVWQAYEEKDFINALDYYFHFIEELKNREPYFREQFDVCPEFKAGLNCGEITVAEVGSIKRDVAYHGDNINIAARLLALCSDLQEDILVTQGFKNQVKNSGEYKFNFLQEVQLKGKLKTTNVYSVAKEAAKVN